MCNGPTLSRTNAWQLSPKMWNRSHHSLPYDSFSKPWSSNFTGPRPRLNTLFYVCVNHAAVQTWVCYWPSETLVTFLLTAMEWAYQFCYDPSLACNFLALHLNDFSPRERCAQQVECLPAHVRTMRRSHTARVFVRGIWAGETYGETCLNDDWGY